MNPTLTCEQSTCLELDLRTSISTMNSPQAPKKRPFLVHAMWSWVRSSPTSHAPFVRLTCRILKSHLPQRRWSWISLERRIYCSPKKRFVLRASFCLTVSWRNWYHKASDS